MKINTAMKKLRELHSEFGNLIDRLEEVDTGEDMGYYEDLLQDIHWSNVMLSNRYKRMLEKKQFHERGNKSIEK